MDNLTAEQRKKTMQHIRSKDTKPELWIRQKLFREGYRYRKNVNYLPGHPDLWLAKYNTVIFVHGCFWHRHPGCKYAYKPKSRVDYWEEKFQKNRTRDCLVRSQLLAAGHRILILWECTIKKAMKSEQFAIALMRKVQAFLIDNIPFKEL